MTILLFPGRHLANTRFQQEYLSAILGKLGEEPEFLLGKVPTREGTLDQLVFAITSCNREGSRYNSVPFHVRSIGVDRFARQFKESLGISYRIVGIPQMTHNFRSRPAIHFRLSSEA